ncbi:hypothetical protein WDW37_08130 [Bdellovibrionota bacterium FG-1]
MSHPPLNSIALTIIGMFLLNIGLTSSSLSDEKKAANPATAGISPILELPKLAFDLFFGGEFSRTYSPGALGGSFRIRFGEVSYVGIQGLGYIGSEHIPDTNISCPTGSSSSSDCKRGAVYMGWAAALLFRRYLWGTEHFGVYGKASAGYANISPTCEKNFNANCITAGPPDIGSVVGGIGVGFQGFWDHLSIFVESSADAGTNSEFLPSFNVLGGVSFGLF